MKKYKLCLCIVFSLVIITISLICFFVNTISFDESGNELYYNGKKYNKIEDVRLIDKLDSLNIYSFHDEKLVRKGLFVYKIGSAFDNKVLLVDEFPARLAYYLCEDYSVEELA